MDKNNYIFKEIRAYAVYPSIILIGLVTYYGAMALHLTPAISSFLAAIISFCLIMQLEKLMPYEDNWLPTTKEIKTDLVYMLLIQVVLPKFLALFLLAALSYHYELHLNPVANFWPHMQPIWLQMLLMMFTADFFRYWLHRAAHRWRWLWRFHAVHHSPQKLYWLNVGRFHPIDKTLQFICDTLPFILIGVSAEVLALYFVIYSIKGFFQHSNVDIKLGCLNFIISGPELHRWHHSKIIKESDNNYGNNFIVWDLLFGTYFLPEKVVVSELGLINRHYPTGFLAQMQTPFIKDLDKKTIIHANSKIVNFFIKLHLIWIKYTIWRKLVADSISPTKCQAKVLRRILQDNLNTEFANLHGFSAIDGIDNYLKRLPIFDYEELHKFINKQIETKSLEIASEVPKLYVRTSGTTNTPKYIPTTRKSLTSYKKSQHIAAYRQHCTAPGIFAGRILVIVSAEIEGHLNDDTVYGSMSNLIANSMPQLIKNKYILPSALLEVEDYETKYLLIAAFSLKETNISCIATANPTTILKINDIIQQHSESLIKFVASGNFDDLDVKLDEQQISKLKAMATNNPSRAKELTAIKAQGNFCIATIWPQLQAVVTWTGGNCGSFVPKLKKQIAPTCLIIEMGYMASEYYGSITVDCENNLCIPTIQDNFFEFIEVNAWNSGSRDTLTIAQLKIGLKYYIIVTTAAGLYRYFINDIIEVTGYFNNTPTICFVQKGSGVTSLTGEKLYEEQVVKAVNITAGSYNLENIFFMMLADQKDTSYQLYLEIEGIGDLQKFELEFNNNLKDLNMEYKSKTQSGRLQPANIKILRPGTFQAYKSFCFSNGQREGQFKLIQLLYKTNVEFPFNEYVIE